MEFAGKRALVTGASSGIGKAVARQLAQRGAAVAAVARRKEVLAELASVGKVHPIAADLTIASQRERCFRASLDALHGLDILVHAAGIIGTGTIENTTMEQWDAMMNINLTAIFHLTQLALPSLMAGKGNIVSVSSVAGSRSFPGVLAYAVSKAALDQFTRCAALELAPHGVRVNAVNPGVVVTNLHRSGGMNEEQYQGFLERSKTTHPLGRVGTAEEVADLVLFLASDRASWITGVTYGIDGGRALTCAR
jgi:NAD(P)-dependent dehydrogenase (short-subunit alcohol dehydrogenase family)